MNKKYVVRLTDEERDELLAAIKKLKEFGGCCDRKGIFKDACSAGS
jgi:hypothetical protein